MELCQVGVGLNIAENHSLSLKEVLSGHIFPTSNEKLTKLKLVQVGVRANTVTSTKSELHIMCQKLIAFE